MKVILTGTGTSQGIPMIGCQCPVCTSTNPKDKRTRSSVYIETEKTSFVIDTGPDFRQQMLNAKANKLDAVLFTHSHKDHIAGLDDIRPFNYLKGTTIDVFAETSVQEVLKREYQYIFEGDYPGVPKINLRTISPDVNFFVGEQEIIPIRVMHMKMPVLGFRMGNFAYITDANYISENEMNKLKGLDTLIINALRIEKHYSHYNFEEALSVIEILKPAQAYLTHISHHLGLHDQIIEMCPEGVLPGYDGLTFTVK